MAHGFLAWTLGYIELSFSRDRSRYRRNRKEFRGRSGCSDLDILSLRAPMGCGCSHKCLAHGCT